MFERILLSLYINVLQTSYHHVQPFATAYCTAVKGINKAVFIFEVSFNLLCAIKPGVTEALSGNNMTDAIKTMTAVVFTVLAICAIGAAHVTPITHRKNVLITHNVILKLRSMSHGHYHSARNSLVIASS